MKHIRLVLAAFAWVSVGEAREIPVPTIVGDWWRIAGNPDLGAYTSDRQQPVDFGIWQAADGTWQLWSCIRNTHCPGTYTQRLLYGWEGASLVDSDWQPKGVTWLAKPELGEIQGGMQAPHVIREGETFYLFYGDWRRICLASSPDGKQFTRMLGSHGQPDLFTEDPAEPAGNNTARDAMVSKVGNTFLCYYTSHTAGSDGVGKAYCRLSLNLRDWSESFVVADTPPPPDNSSRYSDECPHVVYLDEAGLYYLFVTQRYGRHAQTTVYASPTPVYFGINSDARKVCTLPVAAPEIIVHQGRYYMAALTPALDGIQMAGLDWK